MTTDAQTHMTTIDIQLAEDERSNLRKMANRIEMVNSLFVVSIWSISVEQEQVQQEQHLTDAAPTDDLRRHSAYMRDARQQADRLELECLRYNSPLWLTVGSAAVTGVPAIGYGVLRMYEKLLDLRAKKSNVDLLRLTNEQIMDDLRFNQRQKHLILMAMDPKELLAPAPEGEVVPQGIPSRPANEPANPLAYELLNPIQDAAAALQLVCKVNIETRSDRAEY
jgi:hypothetical protein